jgi:predicted amidohydrolase
VQGADIIVLPELFLGQYFCKEHNAEHFESALSGEIASNPYMAQFSNLAKELNVVIPFSFFERSNQVYYNTVAMLDSNGDVLGKYRKSHIPTGPGPLQHHIAPSSGCTDLTTAVATPGYQEKYYFSPGDTGFKVFQTRKGAVGVGICWDQVAHARSSIPRPPRRRRARTQTAPCCILYIRRHEPHSILPPAQRHHPPAFLHNRRFSPAHWRVVVGGSPLCAGNRPMRGIYPNIYIYIYIYLYIL